MKDKWCLRLKKRQFWLFWTVDIFSACQFCGISAKTRYSSFFAAAPSLSVDRFPIRSNFSTTRCFVYMITKTFMFGRAIFKLFYVRLFAKNNLPPGACRNCFQGKVLVYEFRKCVVVCVDVIIYTYHLEQRSIHFRAVLVPLSRINFFCFNLYCCLSGETLVWFMCLRECHHPVYVTEYRGFYLSLLPVCLLSTSASFFSCMATQFLTDRDSVAAGCRHMSLSAVKRVVFCLEMHDSK